MGSKTIFVKAYKDKVYTEDASRLLEYPLTRGLEDGEDRLEVVASAMFKAVAILYEKGILSKDELLDISGKYKPDETIDVDEAEYRVSHLEGTRYKLEKVWLEQKEAYDHIENLSVEVVGTGTEKQMKRLRDETDWDIY